MHIGPKIHINVRTEMTSILKSFILKSVFIHPVIRMEVTKMMSSVKIPLDYIVQQSDISFESKTYEFCKQYYHLPFEKKMDVLKELALKYDFDKEATKKAAESYITFQNKGTGVQIKTADRLRSALNPSYAYAFNRIRKINGGVKFLVDVREDLLKALPSLDFNDDSTVYLKSLNNYLKEVLSFSFNIGFLKLERITWESPCYMLEKISQYEAIHPVRNWTDIKQRVGPYRRCFVFTHSSMPKEPVIVLHTALTNDISTDIASIVKKTKSYDRPEENMEVEMESPEQIGAAVFYSITLIQKGLFGIELGNQLIKRAVQEVLSEFPHIAKLSSLSPIPGFKEWLLLEIKKVKTESSVISSFLSESDKKTLGSLGYPKTWDSLQNVIASNRWVDDAGLKDCLKTPLMKMCAHYLHEEKRRARALNSVANFHLCNGAVMWRLNWLADTSPRGLDNSCGMMVNYRYYLNETESNSKRYLENHHINASEDFKSLLVPAFTKSSL